MTEMNKTAHGETQQTVTRTIDASAKDVFDFLTLPANHAKFDGSGMVQSDDKTQRIQKVGDVFTMNMHCLLYTSPSPRDRQKSRMPSSA